MWRRLGHLLLPLALLGCHSGIKAASQAGTAPAVEAPVESPRPATDAPQSASTTGGNATPAGAPTAPVLPPAPDAPTAPTATTAAGGAAAAFSPSTTVHFHWVSPLDGAASFRVTWYATGDCAGTGTDIDPVAATATAITGANGNVYSFTVRAKDATSQESTPSVCSNALFVDTAPPKTPAAPAAPGALTSATSVAFTWADLGDDGVGSGVVAYNVKVGTTPDGDDVFDGPVQGTAKTVAGADGATYYARVQAVDAAGNSSAFSPASAGVTVDATAPLSGNGGAIATSDVRVSSVTLTWAAATDGLTIPGDLRYAVFYSTANDLDTVASTRAHGTPFGGDTTGSTTATITGLGAGKQYWFNVLVRDQAGNETAYVPQSASTPHWQGMATANSLGNRERLTGAWTGATGNPATADRLIAWGGADPLIPQSSLADGAIYDPATDAWTPMSSLNAPAGRRWQNKTSMWTGDTGNAASEYRMIVWAGLTGVNTGLNTGAIYEPASDTWTTMSMVNAPPPTDQHANAWIGDTGDPATSFKMAVWGGKSGDNHLFLFDPATNSWTRKSNASAPPSTMYATMVWTGQTGVAASRNKLIVWGGIPLTNAGGVYDLATDTWTPTSLVGAPTQRRWQSAVWTGDTGDAIAHKMVLWGGYDGVGLGTGGIYDPATDSWTPTSQTNAPAGFWDLGIAWTGSKVLIISQQLPYFYDPLADAWTAIDASGIQGSSRYGLTFWTGTNIVLYGGGLHGSIYHP